MKSTQRPCAAPECRKNIDYRNKSGLCRAHLDEKLGIIRNTEVKYCDTCGDRLLSGVKGHRCGICISIKAATRTCAKCTTRIKKQVKSGLCRTHYRETLPPRKSRTVSEVVVPKFRLSELIRATAEVSHYDKAELTGPYRFRNLVRFRMAISHIATLGGYSQFQIGKALNRDHTTICHALKGVDRALTDWKFNLLIDRINAQLAQITTARKMERIAA